MILKIYYKHAFTDRSFLSPLYLWCRNYIEDLKLDFGDGKGRRKWKERETEMCRRNGR